MKNQTFNQTNSSTENIPLHTELRMVCGFVCTRIERKNGTPSRLRSWLWVQYLYFLSRLELYMSKEKIFSWFKLPRFIWNKSIRKYVLLNYLNSPDLYRLLSRSWPCLLVCTPWSGCRWWGSCTVGTPLHTGSHIGCSGRCTPPRHCTWCNSRQTGQTSLVNTEGRWSGDLA